jgi:hypothetical protein
VTPKGALSISGYDNAQALCCSGFNIIVPQLVSAAKESNPAYFVEREPESEEERTVRRQRLEERRLQKEQQKIAEGWIEPSEMGDVVAPRRKTKIFLFSASPQIG